MWLYLLCYRLWTLPSFITSPSTKYGQPKQFFPLKWFSHLIVRRCLCAACHFFFRITNLVPRVLRVFGQRVVPRSNGKKSSFNWLFTVTKQRAGNREVYAEKKIHYPESLPAIARWIIGAYGAYNSVEVWAPENNQYWPNERLLRTFLAFIIVYINKNVNKKSISNKLVFFPTEINLQEASGPSGCGLEKLNGYIASNLFPYIF